MLGPWGPKNGRNSPFGAIGGKNRINGCDATNISVVLPLGIIRFSAKIRFHPSTSWCSLGWWYEVAISM
jgi:hypothetical protein